MRVALIGDSHFDASSRFAECIRVHEWIADDIARRGVGLVMHSGDVFERRSNPEERRAFADWVRAVTEHAPLVIVRGNHDALGDLALFRRLRTKHPVIVEEACGVHTVAGVAVACLAWPRKAQILAAADSMSVEEGAADAGDALRNVLRALGMALEQHDGPRVLLAHAMVRGSKTSAGQPLVGCDMEISVGDLALVNADFIALGHIHMPQEWEGPDALGGAPIVYPGSPRRTAFGEVEEKGYVIAELNGRRDLRWERIATPCAPMLLVEGKYNEALGAVDPGLNVPTRETAVGAEIRFRYEVPADAREAARRKADEWRHLWLGYGAAHVKVEEVVIASTRARAPEVAEARTTWAQLEAHWASRHDMPAPERLPALKEKLSTIEEAMA